jgi:hypothetical protein
MKEIPVEFMPGFWVSIPEGLEGKGSGFLLAENIKSIFSVNCVIPKSQDFKRSWTILDMTEDELNNTNYLNAITRIISESWIDTMSVIIVGSENSIRKLLIGYLINHGRINKEHVTGIINSKIGNGYTESESEKE